MKIFSWNVNGLRAAIKKGSLAEFFVKFQPEMLSIQETKAQPAQVDLGNPMFANYRYYFNSAERKGYSGTAIFVRKDVMKPMNVLYNLPARLADRYDFSGDELGDPNTEGRLVAIEFAKFFLVNVYVPNSKEQNLRLHSRSDKWDPALRDYLAELRVVKPVIFCGDMNVAHKAIDLANPKANMKKHGFTIEERTGFSNILSAGFVDSFREKYPDARDHYTWWSHWGHARENNVGWRIDYFGVDERLRDKIVDASIYPEITGSDHCPISVEIEL